MVVVAFQYFIFRVFILRSISNTPGLYFIFKHFTLCLVFVGISSISIYVHYGFYVYSVTALFWCTCDILADPTYLGPEHMTDTALEVSFHQISS